MTTSSFISGSGTGIHQVLKRYWGFDAFRPMQEDIINSVLNGHDTLALLPTGGGKSLCYQVPALVQDGICLVISPLIALMKDQVENLRRKDITAFAIFSGMSWKEVRNTLITVSDSNCKFLYVSPERLETALFKEYLPGMNIRLIAVDEAHCISQWGYDFRPPYLRISALRDELPGVPVLALTASATPDVQEDICNKLNVPSISSLQDNSSWNTFRQSFERANLSYSVFQVDSKINKIVSILENVPGTGIVYCKSRKRTKEISELLQMHGISSDYYHAGLTQEERSNKQEDWINNKIRVIVCTNAFGMGIDKPDVRVVVHADVPDCLENYYQEAGRAGRDGKKSYAVLLHDEMSLEELSMMVEQRFPSLDDVRMVYQSVANFLQIGSGTGAGEYYDFDLRDFISKFKINSNTALYGLKALEQEGWVSFNEQVFLPPTIRFNTTKAYLYAFQKENPKLDALIKTLLRAYEGIFDQFAFVSEIVIAQLLKKDADEVKRQLTDLHNAGVIEYKPRKEKPQLLILKPRVPVEQLTLDMEKYNKRKEKLKARVKQMIEFVKDERLCRGQSIASYFGDNHVKACGICDNCLRKKTIQLSKEDFESIHARVIELIQAAPISINDLLKKLKGYQKEKAWKAIDILQIESKIVIGNDGLLSLP